MRVTVERLSEFLDLYDSDTPVHLTLEAARDEDADLDDCLVLELAMDELLLQARDDE